MKFLVLNHTIKNYTGSEINAIQLCEGLKNLGHDADLGTFVSGSPLEEIIKQKNIKCLNLLQETNLDLKYDVIWAHHSPVLTQLIFKNKLQNCKILFSSLSPIIALESPPFYFKEINLFLSLSKQNSKVMIANGINPKNIFLFPNYAPKSFFDASKKNHQKELKNIAIISNNRSNEVLQLIQIFREKNYFVETFGYHGQQVLVDEIILKKFDLIITIGKTVQYCFALKLPVYVYDHFGGPGYITNENYELSKDNNFSGRGINRFLNPNELFSDITMNYEKSLKGLDFLYNKASEFFCLESNLLSVLNIVEKELMTNIEKIKKDYKIVERINDFYIQKFNENIQLEKQIQYLSSHILHLNGKIMDQINELSDFKKSFSWNFIYRIEKKIKKINPIFFQKLFTLAYLKLKSLKKRYYSQEEIKFLIDHGFFDESWYIENNPDVIDFGYIPIEHFLLFGILEGRSPNKNFLLSDFFNKFPGLERSSLRNILDVLIIEISNNT